MADTIFLNGVVGAGKTTTASALAAAERGAGIPHAVLDLDEIRRAWPAPAGDGFHLELELANLGALAANFRAAGARHLILAGVLERREDLVRYRDAVGGTEMLVCRLTAPPATISARLTARHADDPAALRWHLERAIELAAVLAAAEVDDVVVDTASRAPEAVAAEVRAAAGW